MNTTYDPRNRRVLVIDDNRAIHADFRKILGVKQDQDNLLAEAAAELFGAGAGAAEGLQFDLDSAYQGQDGLALAKEAIAAGRPFALAFVDIRMPPGWDGIETTAHLLQEDPDLQIVICTAYSDYSWDEMTHKLGCQDRVVILKKPFDVIEIQQMANALTEKWRLTRQARRTLEQLDNLVQQRTLELQVANAELTRDIQQRQQAEEALRESEQRLSEIIGFLPDATFATDCQGRVIAWNRAMEEMTGTKAEDMLGKGDFAYALCFFGTRKPMLLDMVTGANPTPSDPNQSPDPQADVLVMEVEARLQGRKRALWAKARPLYNSKGEVVGAIETLRDVTERKELEGQLRQAQKMEAFGQLAAGVAHDFNNILTVIQGNASLLEARADQQSEWATATSEICAASERAANLTRQLLTFSQRQLFQPKMVDLNDVVANMTRMLRRVIGEHITLEARYDSVTALVNADLGMMEQILVNLAVNSRDAMPHGGRLLVETSSATFTPQDIAGRANARPGDFIHLAVTDTGSGISPENLPRVFEPFFTTKEPGKGTGLGLATVYGIVERHQAWIEIQSKVNVGTTIHIYFPLLEQKTVPPASALPASQVRGGNETILLVEDEAVLRQLFSHILEQKGYRVYEAESGVAALQLWQSHRAEINMLLTDMVMPGGIGGRELAERMLGDKPGLKVIYCSGYTDDMLGKDSILRVNANFLEKPFTPDVLLRRMRDSFDLAN